MAAVAAVPPIRRLEESVVNRIAAGEVIQRPASALKELLENSLDAGATSVAVVVKDGGLKLLQVSDNGHGIRFEDLPILCERHTTSKITLYEDLQKISTLGFRGEALASMAFVAHLSVTTMIEGETHGYRASYRDGVMEGDPRPCAAVKGTQITVENLFYNVIARRKAFKNPSEEYGRILDVISRYAIQKVGVSFSCKKSGETRADVQTLGTTSRIDTIRAVYGPRVAHELIEVTASDEDLSRPFKMEGYISSANYSAKRTIMVLFINDRLVDCAPLKRAIEVVYASILPKASKPFIYISISMPSEHVDVNVHPTKREVSFLNQESLIEAIQKAVESELLRSNTTRTFYTQTLLPGASTILHEERASQTQSTQKAPVNKLVRTDSQNPAGSLHAFLMKEPSGAEPESDVAVMRRVVKQRRNPKESASLTSLQELLAAVDKETHSGLLDIVKNCTFVGMADDILALVQHKTRLYLLNCLKLSKELMYQQALRRFAHFNALRLTNPASLYDLIVMALDEEEECGKWHESDGPKEEIAKLSSDLLVSKVDLLREYFSVDIDETGNLCTLPLILDQYTPDMDRLPLFVLNLGNNVDWSSEKQCFESLAAALADFYAVHPPLLPRPSEDSVEFYKLAKDTPTSMTEDDATDEDLLSAAENKWAQRDWTIQHVLFPAMKLFLKPPAHMASDGTAIQVACLENLYKIFERC